MVPEIDQLGVIETHTERHRARSICSGYLFMMCGTAAARDSALGRVMGRMSHLAPPCFCGKFNLLLSCTHPSNLRAWVRKSGLVFDVCFAAIGAVRGSRTFPGTLQNVIFSANLRGNGVLRTKLLPPKSCVQGGVASRILNCSRHNGATPLIASEPSTKTQGA